MALLSNLRADLNWRRRPIWRPLERARRRRGGHFLRHRDRLLSAIGADWQG